MPSQVRIPFYGDYNETDPVKIAEEGVELFKKERRRAAEWERPEAKHFLVRFSFWPKKPIQNEVFIPTAVFGSVFRAFWVFIFLLVRRGQELVGDRGSGLREVE